MNKKEQELLSQQIGDLGSSESDTQENPLAGQKLKRVGKKPDLTDEEKSELNEFLEKTKNVGGTRIFRSGNQMIGSQEYENDIVKGWIPMDREELGKRGMFYPESWEFRIRPATVQAIKSWNQIDETRRDSTYVLNNVFNEIVKNCVSISTPTGNLNWTHLNSWDRFFFIVRVREYSFSSRSNVEFTDVCESCGEEMTFTLTSDKLYYEFPDDDVIEKHYDAVNRCWTIDPKEYDLTGPIIHLYIPTLGKDDIILQWAYAQAQMGKTLDETFIKFLPWMLSKAPKDLKLADKMIKDCYAVYKNWDMEMFDFMDEIIRNINITPEEQLSEVCPSCGVEVHSSVQFQNGIKSLFAMESKHRKFGTK